MKKFLLLLIGWFIAVNISAHGDFELRYFKHASQPMFEGKNFRAVALAREGLIWAGSHYHGVVMYNLATNKWDGAFDLGNVLVTDNKTDHYGNVWISNPGRSGIQGGGSNIGGGIRQFHGAVFDRLQIVL